MKIENCIPLISNGAGAPRKYPFFDMSVGESVFFANEPLGSQAKQVKAAKQVERRIGFKFKSRAVDGGVRIWRVA